MIYDDVAHAGRYRGISVWLDKAIDCMEQTDFTALEPGTYQVDGEDVYYMVQAPALKEEADTKWEIHRRYIDIQIGLEDGEGISYLPADQVEGWQAYNDQKDVTLAFGPDTGVMLPLNKGMFALLFPHDGHRPCMKIGEAAEGRKVVFKVRV